MRTHVEQRVKEIVADHMDIDESRITGSTKLIDDLGADSLDCVEICMMLENEYNLDCPDEEIEHIVTIDQLTEFIQKKIHEPVSRGGVR
jgi:acyl carrier protein